MADDEEIGKAKDEPEDIYKEDERDSLTEDEGSIKPWEEGFMEGASGDGQDAKCANCGNALMRENLVEKEINSERRWFCSDNCVRNYEKHHNSE